MEYKDYYKILEIDKNASLKDIKKAYRVLARKYHPDVNADKAAEAKFKEINEAYEVLKDKDKRAKYDEFGQYWEHADKMGAGASGFGKRPGPGYSTQFDFGDLSSLFKRGGAKGAGQNMGVDFSEFFQALFGNDMGGAGTRTGGGRRTTGRPDSGFPGFGFESGRPGPQAQAYPKPRDVEFPLELTLEEAAFGVTKYVNFNREAACQACSAHGQTMAGICQTCHGSGVIIKPRKLEVRVPPGVRDGSKIRMRGEGTPGAPGRESGDLFLVVRLLPHQFYELKEGRLYCNVPITPPEGVLGAEIDVPTLRGKVSLKIPPQTQNGRIFRIRDQGFPVQGSPGKNGDFFVRTRIVIPTEATEEEQRLYRQLRSLSRENPRQHLVK